MYLSGDTSRIAAGEAAVENGKRDILISGLKSKSMKSLYFSSCNSVNPDIQNTSDEFLKVVITKEITAWDGGTIFNYKTKQLEAVHMEVG